MAHPQTHIPHTVRLMIALLRITIGLQFFYIAFHYILHTPLTNDLVPNGAMGNLYNWLAAPQHAGFISQSSQWALLVIGISLIVGFATRLLSLFAIFFLSISYISIHPLSGAIPRLVNDTMVLILCLLLFIFSRAGTYLGLDRVFRLSIFRRGV